MFKFHANLTASDYAAYVGRDGDQLEAIAAEEAESLRALGGEFATITDDEVLESLLEFVAYHKTLNS